MKNKKGDIFDIISFVVVLTVVAMVCFIFAFTIPQISDGLNEAGLNSSSEGVGAIDSLHDFGTITMQRGFFLVFAGLIIGMMISAFFIRTHLIWVFLYIIFLGVSIILAVYMGNAYQTMVAQSIFSERAADQVLINLVMNNLIKIVLGAGALSLIIIFTKFSSASTKI